MMKHRKLLLCFLLLLAVGFALVTSTLLITGNVKVATNNADFDVKFTKVFLDGADISTEAISPDGKTITFSTKDLSTVGDRSKLDFEVINNSTMYDAEVSVECSAGAKGSYYEIAKEVVSPIVAQTTGTGKVEVKLLKATVTDFREEFTCTLKAIAKERTAKAEKPKYIPKYFAIGKGSGLDIPTTASTQDYTILTYPDGVPGAGEKAKVFMGLDEDGVQKSVCFIENEGLECFKNNNVAEEQEHVKRVFGEANCSGDSRIYCESSDFYCNISSNGTVNCHDRANDFFCTLYSDSSVYCSVT